ncbi:MAG: pyridoxal-phosphate dependent enzyme [Candidatus Abyssobacteria bacterium SURF_17]|uniref:Pyridoxal-phosphate dependent enzyme n=1 Tax=Candidatus Abyssobacteria bacterium SURF_17 TaxID=2093361 RepID=A0A419EUC2_9BACT|nr:MAG: pyridoxal-phosphate dependent enzyme [Candidatus Abyssubacteria bacterium SURF_17]
MGDCGRTRVAANGGDTLREPTIIGIREASERIKQLIHRTPVLTCDTLNRICDAELHFKCENFQKTGSFKIRGATNAVLSLSEEEASRGVATHSSGNHAAALALAARWRGIRAYVVMPENAPAVKREAVGGCGGEIIYCKPTLKAREEELAKVLERTGAVFVPPYNDYRVIAGQGTAALELCEEVRDFDVVMAPVGGGGLLSGTAIAARSLSPATKVYGAEPEQADDAFRSFRAGRIVPADNPNTIADGLRTSLGELTFPIIQKYIADIVTVREEAIKQAMRLIWERMKIIVEPSAAVPLGAVLTKRGEVPGKRIGIILSGGNVDLTRLPFG